MIRTAVPTPRPVLRRAIFRPADAANRTLVVLRDGSRGIVTWVAADGSTVRVLVDGAERLERGDRLERVVGRYRVS